MSELESIVSAVCSWLETLGIRAAAAYIPGAARRHTEPIVTVGLKTGAAMTCGQADYLGIKTDETGASRELYAKRADLTLELDIWAPRTAEGSAQACADIFGTLAARIPALPGGIRVREISCGETRFDETAGMYFCPAAMSATVFLYAQAEEDGMFTDFYVKGVLKS